MDQSLGYSQAGALLGAVSPPSPSVTANEEGPGLTRVRYPEHFIQSRCPGTAVEVNIQFSVDNVNWVDSGVTLTGNDYIFLDLYVPYIRAVRDNTTNPVTVLINSGPYYG